MARCLMVTGFSLVYFEPVLRTVYDVVTAPEPLPRVTRTVAGPLFAGAAVAVEATVPITSVALA